MEEKYEAYVECKLCGRTKVVLTPPGHSMSLRSSKSLTKNILSAPIVMTTSITHLQKVLNRDHYRSNLSFFICLWTCSSNTLAYT